MSVLLYNNKHHTYIPPYNHLAEEIVLGGILVNPYIVQLVVDELITESFSIETHQIIYRATVNIYSKYRQIDPILLINILWELNLLQKIGGITKILRLLKQGQICIVKSISEVTLLHYINIIKTQYARRLLIQHGYYTIKLGYLSSTSYANIFSKINKHLTEVNYLLDKSHMTQTNVLLTSLLMKIKSKDLNVSLSNNLISGFSSLDNLINGFKKGDLIIIAGRPSMGKTSFGLNIISSAIYKCNAHVVLFSLEMSQEQLLYRLLSIVSSIPINKIQQNNITSNEWYLLQKYSTQLLQSHLYIDDTANLSISHLIRKIKNLQKQNKIHLVVIDYLQLVHLDFALQNLSNRTQELSLVTRTLKTLAKELNLPIIALSQLNRNLEKRPNKKPLLSDLRESGCITSYTELITHYKLKVKLLHTFSIIKEANKSRNKINLYKITAIRQQYIVFRKYKQHVYIILNKNKAIVELTHNHSMLTRNGWIKNDQLKSYHLLYFGYLHSLFLSDNQYQHINTIIFTSKKSVYDITTHENTSFSANQNIILHNSIEQDADLILFLYRDAYYKKDILNTDLTDIIIAKHRNGPTGIVQLNFNNTLSSFENLML